MRGGPGSVPRGVGYINPRASSGYTSLSITRETRRILQDLQNATSITSADELIYRLVAAELLERDKAQDLRDSIESHDRPSPGERDSIEQSALSPSTPEGR